MRDFKNFTPQSLVAWEPEQRTLLEMKTCELVAAVVMKYRETHNFLHSPCWMDEWALGYFCALRDNGILNGWQWHLLCSAFQPEELNDHR